MTRPRVLCVSSNRDTRATIALALTELPIHAVIAHTQSQALNRLETESVDAVIVDGATVDDIPAFVRAVDERTPETATFLYAPSGTETTQPVLGEVVETADGSQAAVDHTASLSRLLSNRLMGPSEPADHLTQLRTDIKCQLADSATPNDVERVLREVLTAQATYQFVWIGEYDRGEREVVPWLPTHGEETLPIRRTFPIGDGSQPLLEGALHRRELQFVQDLKSQPSAAPLGPVANEHGVRAVAVAPLVSDKDRYGVLVVYATEPFSEPEREMLTAISKTASRVLESIAVRGQLAHTEQVLARYERLVETAGDGMYILDAEGHVTTINDALLEMSGYTREGVLGEHVSMYLGPEDVKAGNERIKTLLKEGKDADTIELAIKTKTGEAIPCEAQIAILRTDGEFTGTVGVLRDITERKRRERQLREKNKRLDAFASILSHDLRNPLSVASGYLDLLDKTNSREHISPIRAGLDRMEEIIQDVLMIAREGDTITEREPIDLATLTQTAWKTVTTEGATLEIEGTVTIDGDRSRIQRLLENLFRNAVEHGGSSVTVQVGTLADQPGFYVADDGSGIPDSIRGQLFESNVSASSSGLGIGLWVVKEVANGHGWTAVATDSDNGGARFEFEFDSSAESAD